MAGSSIIGALRVVLGADTAALDKGLKDAHSSLKSFAAGATQVAAGIGLERIIEKSVDSFVHSIKKAFEAADELGKSAQKIGIPVEELAKLKYAAELSDVSMQQLEKGVGKLSQAMTQMAGGAVNESTRAFKAMGITAKDAGGSTTELLIKLAEKFEATKDSAGKTALAMTLFGKSGKDLIPLLNSGAEGLRTMYEEAEKLGLVFSKETVAATTHFNDDMKTMQRVLTGLSNQVVAGLAPAFATLLERFKEYVKNGDLVKGVSQGALNLFLNLWEAAGTLALALERVKGEFSGLFTALSAFKDPTTTVTQALALMKKGWNEQEGAIDKYNKGIVELKTRLQQFVVDAGTNAAKWAAEMGKGHTDAATGVEKHKSALDKFIESQTKALISSQQQVLAADMGTGALERMRVVQQALTVATQAKEPIDAAHMARITALGNETELAAQKLKGYQLVQAAVEPHEKYRKEIANNELVLRAFGATTEEIAAVQKKTAEKYGNTWEQVGESVAGSVAAIGNSFAKESKSMAMVAKAAGIVQATISMFVGGAKALELPFPANIAAWAAVVAKGAAIVASIKSTAVTGFKTGADFIVPGGIGGGDRVPFNAMLEPGERVQITPNSDRSGGGQSRSSSGTTTVYIDAALRPLAEALFPHFNAAIRDGHELKLAPA